MIFPVFPSVSEKVSVSGFSDGIKVFGGFAVKSAGAVDPFGKLLHQWSDAGLWGVVLSAIGLT